MVSPELRPQNSYTGKTITYTYDAVGNRLTKVDSGARTTYTYDAANEVLTEDASGTLTTYTYDENGNTLTTDAAGAVTTMTWSYEDEMLTVKPSGGGTVTMVYDGDHLRRKRQNGSGTTKHVWDDQQVLLETNGNGVTQARYTLAPFGYGDLVSMRRASTTSFYHSDALGSTRALTDGDEAVTDTYLYSAFGNLLASTGSTENPYRYIGELGYQQETGLSGYYLRRRYYQPGAGSFLSCDPVALAGTSAYAYVGNRPAMGADPSGLKCDPRTCKPRRVQKNRKTHTHTEYTWCPSAKKYKQPIWGKLTVWWDTWDVYDEDWGCVPVLICRGLAVEDFCKLHSSKLVARGYSTGSYMCVGERVGPPVTNPYEPGQKLCESVCKATCEAFGLFAHAVICHYVGADLTCWIVHFTLDPVGAACDTFCTDLCDFV